MCVCVSGNFFQKAVVSILKNGVIRWTVRKCMKKKLEGK